MAAIFCDVPITFEKFDRSRASRRLDQRDTKLMHTRRSPMIELRKEIAKTINPVQSEIISSNAILNLLFLSQSHQHYIMTQSISFLYNILRNVQNIYFVKYSNFFRKMY